MGKHTKLKAGFVQFDVVYSDFENNINEVKKGIEVLHKNEVELAVLPEMWSSGFDYASLEDAAEKTLEILKIISEISKEYNMVIAGTLPFKRDGKIYNTLFVMEKDGKIAAKYEKIHLFSYSGEHKGFVRGNRPVVADTSVGRLGLMICYDLRFPELGRALVDMGADIFIVPGQWPLVRQNHWEILLRARAIEDQLFVIGCNRCGRDNLEYGGSSMIISPKGRVLYQAKDEFEVGFSTLEFMEMIEYRSQIPALRERVDTAYRVDNE